jgi:hypothetical protein
LRRGYDGASTDDSDDDGCPDPGLVAIRFVRGELGRVALLAREAPRLLPVVRCVVRALAARRAGRGVPAARSTRAPADGPSAPVEITPAGCPP